MTDYVITTVGARRWHHWSRMLEGIEAERESDHCQRIYAWVWDPLDQLCKDQLGRLDKCAVVGAKVPTPVEVSTDGVLTRAAAHNLPILHVEDDWDCRGHEQPGWLDLALEVLRKHPDVGQVRLRTVREYLERGNNLTKAPVTWLQYDGYRASVGAVQCAFPPSLWRPEAVRDTFPAGSEHDAGLHYARAGWRIAQLWPGVFHHLGIDDSQIHGHDRARHEGSMANHAVPEEQV